jgi:NAD(P)-dependent dehydrogenase (short-subunit alcohol dehydrogenase family)
MPWTVQDMPDQTGRTIIVTGGNAGLGLEVVRAFAKRGASVIIACRDLDKGRRAAEQLEGADVDVRKLDLADLASVRAFAEAFDAEHLDVLCNNAGVMALPHRKTVDGFEMQLGTNHFGHFALTGLLLPKLLARPRSRVVTVSSLMHRRAGRLSFADLDGEQSYDKWRAYGQSKLANLMFAYELQRRLDAAAAETISVAAHPGYASTNLAFVGPEMEDASFMRGVMRLGQRFFAQSAEMGALPTIYAAVHEDVRGGDFIGPSGPMQLWGSPRKVESAPYTHDPSTAGRLWEVSVERTGVDYAALAE